jgi:SPP1 gp7 family putative phage head morphogenesis protein
VAGLRGIMGALAAAYVAELEPMLSAIARADANTVLSHALDVLGMRVNIALPGAVGPLFDRMAGGVGKGSDRVIGVKLRELTGAVGNVTNTSVGLQDDIRRARDRNIRLVEDAGRDYAASVRKIVDDPSTFGLRVEEIKAKLLERGSVSASRAELIARDQTLKLNGQIAQTRMMRAGVDQYTWSTSGDDRVREEHAALEGQVFSWSGPPDVGHPGQDFQCRCVAIPYLEELAGIFE